MPAVECELVGFAHPLAPSSPKIRSRAVNTRIGSPWRTLMVGLRLPSCWAATDARSGPPETTTVRRTAGRERARAAEDRQQDRRAEAREEVAVDLPADARLAGEIGRRRSERDRDAVGTNQPRPHEIGAALPGLASRALYSPISRDERGISTRLPSNERTSWLTTART